MSQSYWVITGWNSTEKIYEKKIKHGVVTKENMKILLKTMVAKEALTHDEILGSYQKQRTIGVNELLAVQEDVERHTLSCGDSIWFTAKAIIEE